jgi:rhomboid protease GluP
MAPSNPAEPAPALMTTDGEETALIWGLVLSAVHVPYHIHHHNHTWQLFVTADNELRALYELESYFSENKDWPPRPTIPDHEFIPLVQPPTLLLMGALILFYTVTGTWEQQSLWFTQGAGNAERILEESEWWRLLTALTLHADSVHLLSNCLIGGWLIHFFCRLTGSGLGLFAILVSAGCGNLINVLAQGPNHQFVGFSTAIFAVIGMLSSLAYLRKKHFTGTHILFPLMAGAALLAALGSSGEHTDLGAHLFGLVCGLLSGMLLGIDRIHNLRRSLALQSLLFFLFVSLVIGSWQLALRS